jgi:acetate kinase
VRVLTLNSGSSSLKAAVYDVARVETRLRSLSVTRIGLPGSRVRVTDGSGATRLEREQSLSTHVEALQVVLGSLAEEGPSLHPDVIGHRVVHGGGRFWTPEVVTPDVIATLEALSALDPEHMPHALDGIRAAATAYPRVVQVACFDTGFHRALPPVARHYALPRDLTDGGVVRLGFHGLSYEYITRELRLLEGARADARVIVAHLGNGASMAAIHRGRCIDTTMGFSPAGGLVMGTRCGDLDPGVILYLSRERRMSLDELDALVNQQSGLLGVSGSSGDMGDLLDAEERDPHAAEAVALFCYRAKQYIGACAAALGGLDILIFTAGIGEHAAPVRERITAGLGFLGIELDAERNRRHAPVISTDSSPVTVRVMATNEEVMVARHASQFAW